MRNFGVPILQTISLLVTAAAVQATIVAVPVNITTATGSSATQSTSHPAGPANNGIDGNLGNFTHTNPPEPGLAPGWWEVDLATDRSFSNMRIYNRGDGCCPGRLSDLSVEVRDASNNILFSLGGINAGNALNNPSFIDLALGGALNAARYVRVTRTPIPGQESTHDGATLSIGELIVTNQSDVLLPAGTNLTHSNILGMAVSQSSTLGGFTAGSAVNGSTGDFTHTVGTDTNASWTVDFGEVMNLESFSIDNRTSCCGQRLRDITVTVRDSFGVPVYTSALLNPENVLGSPLSLTDSFPSGTTGRYVTISRTPDPDGSGQGGVPGTADDQNVLSMAEVNVFGSSIPEPSVLALLPLAAFGILRRRR
jgi:hypothetical protein